MLIPTALLSLLTPFQSGGVVVFQGSPGAPGDVAVTDPSGVAATVYPQELQGVRLLPIELHGRTELGRLLGRGRLRTDVPGAARVELPGGAGSLYRFSRVEAGGGTAFGLFVVDATGWPNVVFEHMGIGAGGSGTPFKQRVAVAPDGSSLLIATVPAAGGDLLEVDLASGQVEDRTPHLAPLKFGRAGLALGPTFGVAVAADRILRFDRTPGASAESVALGNGGLAGTKALWFSGELVLSPSGTYAATTAGVGPLSAHVWVFGATGAAARATKTPQPLSPAGFLPEHDHGPYLAVSDDGSRCAWRTEGLTREAFVGSVPTATVAPSGGEHVTSDANYLDTLDEIGQFMFQVSSQLLRVAVGETETGGPGIENLDFYTVGLGASGALSIGNVTQTNGFAQPPFYAHSTLKPVATAWVPGVDGYLFQNETSGGGGVLASSFLGQAGYLSLMADTKELVLMERAGADVVVGLRRASGNKDYELWRVAADLQSATLVVSLPNSSGMDRPAVRPDGWVAFVEETPAKERLWLYDTVSGTLRNYRRLIYGPALDFAPTGELAFTLGAPGGAAIQAALPVAGAPQRLKVPVGPGFVLPGA